LQQALGSWRRNFGAADFLHSALALPCNWSSSASNSSSLISSDAELVAVGAAAVTFAGAPLIASRQLLKFCISNIAFADPLPALQLLQALIIFTIDCGRIFLLNLHRKPTFKRQQLMNDQPEEVVRVRLQFQIVY